MIYFAKGQKVVFQIHNDGVSLLSLSDKLKSVQQTKVFFGSFCLLALVG